MTFKPEITQVGNYTLLIEAKDALNVIYKYTDASGVQRDTLVKASNLNLMYAQQNVGQVIIKINVFDAGRLLFKPIDENYHEHYGFDDALTVQCQQSSDYEKINMNGADYFVSWLGTVKNNDVEIKMEYIGNILDADTKIKLKCSSNNLTMDGRTRETDLYDLFQFQNIIFKASQEGTYYVQAFLASSDGTEICRIGKIKIDSKPMRPVKKVRIIRVKRSDETLCPTVDKAQLIHEVNSLYKQAFLKFDLDNAAYNDSLPIAKATTDMVGLGYLTDSIGLTFANDIYYIFIVSKNNNETKAGEGLLTGGKMTQGTTVTELRLKKASVLFGHTDSDVATHELGHNLGLQHIWENDANVNAYSYTLNHRNRFLIPQYTTRNPMDYIRTGTPKTHRRYFYKYQIEHLITR